MDATIFKAFSLLALCVGGIGVLFYFLRKYSSKLTRNNNTTEMKVTGKLSLMPKSHLFIVKVGDRDLLLGVTEGSINTLADLYTTIPQFNTSASQFNTNDNIENPIEEIKITTDFNQLLQMEEQKAAQSIKTKTVSFGDGKIDKVAAKLKKENAIMEAMEPASQDLSFKSFLKSITKTN